ncbi:MAG: TolC family outer membrane protein [Gammaproteobacteria bacterium]
MMKSFLRIVLSIVLLVVAIPIFAEDLWQVYLQACANDPAYKAAIATYLANKEYLPINRAALLPSVNLAAAVDRQHINLSFPARSPNFSFYNTEKQFAIIASQPVFNFASWMALKGAGAFVKQAEATFFAAQQNLMLRVANAYFAVLQAKDNLTYAEAQRLALGRQLEQTKQQFNVGIIAITDVSNAQASYDAAVATEIAAKNALADKLVELKAITNVQYNSLFGINGRVPLVVPQPADMAQWLQTAERQNYALLSSRYAAQVAQENIKQQFAGHLPVINANAGYSIDDNTNANNQGIQNSKTADIGLSLNLPVYQGGLVTATTEQAGDLYQQAIAQMEQTYRGVQTQTSEAYLGILSSISKIQADAEAVVSSQNSLEATRAAYSVGTRTIIDVLNAETTLYEAKSTYSQDKYTYLLNILSLKQAAGTLSPADLQQINAWLPNSVDVRVTITGTSPAEAIDLHQTKRTTNPKTKIHAKKLNKKFSDSHL